MSFKELLQAIAMLVPTLLVILAATLSLTHPDAPSTAVETAAADPPQTAAPHRRLQAQPLAETDDDS